MLKRYLKLQLFLLLVLFSQPLIADEEQFMNFDDFLFDIKDYINKSIKVQVPVYAVDIPTRLAQVDGNVAVDLERIDRQKIKDIITLCDGVGGSCFLDVSGDMVENPQFFPPYIIQAEKVSMWFLVGVAVSENGIIYIHSTEANAIAAVQEATSFEENYVSGYLWIDSPGVVAIAYGEGGGSYFVGYSFNINEKLARNEAEKNCTEQMGSITKLVTSCSAIIFNVPWW